MLRILKWSICQIVLLTFLLVRGICEFIISKGQRKAILKDIIFFLSVPVWLFTEPDPRQDRLSEWTDDHSYQN